MSDEGPPILRLSEKRALYSASRPRKRPQDYASFSEYFAAEIEPGLRQPEPEARLGYADLKRRR